MAIGTAKEKLTRSALRIMLSHGYSATTVDEICEGAGLSKGSFYHCFDSKEDIGMAALELFHQEGFKRMAAGNYTEIADPVRRVFGFLDHVETVSKDIWGDGCILGNFALELADTHPAIRTRVSALLKKSSDTVAHLFEPIEGILKTKNGPSASDLADHFLSMIEGAIVLGKAHNDWRRIPEGIRQFRRYLECLVAG